MKSIALKKPYNVTLIESPKPVCNDGDILFKMEACGLCRSDLENISRNSCKPTDKLGHEVSGTIIQLGKNVKGFEVGQRVFIHHHSHCKKCYFCNHGNQTMCDKYVDSLQPCGMSEEFLLPEWNVSQGCVFKIPDSMTFEEAALIEPLGCCVRGWKKLKIQKNDSLAIFGVGPIGTMHALLAKTQGIKKIFCLDINEFRLNFCKQKKIGIPFHVNDRNLYEKILLQTENRGVDLVIIATNEMSVLNKAVDLVRKGGTILLFGEPKKNLKIELDMEKLYSKEISIIPSYAATNENINEALELVKKKMVNVEQLITHKFSLNEAFNALECGSAGKFTMKSVILPHFRSSHE